MRLHKLDDSSEELVTVLLDTQQLVRLVDDETDDLAVCEALVKLQAHLVGSEHLARE